MARGLHKSEANGQGSCCRGVVLLFLLIVQDCKRFASSALQMQGPKRPRIWLRGARVEGGRGGAERVLGGGLPGGSGKSQQLQNCKQLAQFSGGGLEAKIIFFVVMGGRLVIREGMKVQWSQPLTISDRFGPGRDEIIL